MRSVLLLTALTLAAFFSISSVQAADDHPSITTAKAMTSAVHAYTNANREAANDAFIAGLQKTLEPFISFRFMVAESMGAASWKEATRGQRDQLEDAFGFTMSRTFYSAFVKKILQDKSGQFETKPEEVGFGIKGKESGKFLVDVSIPGFGDDGNTGNFLFVTGNFGDQGGWQLVDFGGQGVRLVETYQPQYFDIIRDQGIAGLISVLQSKAAEASE
jgi:ABC-type transporter MlaC component